MTKRHTHSGGLFWLSLQVETKGYVLCNARLRPDQMQLICTRFTKHRKLHSSSWRDVYMVIIL